MGSGPSQMTRRPTRTCFHMNRNVEYYNTENRQFLCKLCYLDGQNNVRVEIYTNSEDFKKKESNLVKRLTERKENALQQLKGIEKMKVGFGPKAEKILGDIEKYVDCLRESLLKMKKDLKSKVIEEIATMYNENITVLKELSRNIDMHLNELKRHKGNPAMRIETYNTIMRKDETILKQAQVVFDYSEPVLTFDEKLTIEEIKQNKSLGYLRMQTKGFIDSQNSDLSYLEVSSPRITSPLSNEETPQESTNRDDGNNKNGESRHSESVNDCFTLTPTQTTTKNTPITPSKITANIVTTNEDMTDQHDMQKDYEATQPKEIKKIKLNRKAELSSVVDSAVLSNGLIVLCDRNNQRLILLNSEQEEIDETMLESRPNSVAGDSIENCRVSVLLPDQNVIKTFEIHNNAFSEPTLRKLKGGKQCSGIEYIDGKLFYTAKGAIYRLNNDDTFKEFDMGFHDPKSLYKDPENEKVLFVCCPETKSKQSNGGIVQKYRYEDNEITLTISLPQIHRPSVVTVDNKGDIYVCDSSTGIVHRVTKEGKYVRPVLENELLHFRFIPTARLFIATENQSDIVKFYNIE